jgi:hypothetical protein
MRGGAYRPAVIVALLCTIPLAGRAEGFGFFLHPPAGIVGQNALDEIDRLGDEAKCRSRGPDFCEVLVSPIHPGQNNVRYYDFDWRYFDYLDDRGVGGVRFYYYQREAEVARIAAALVRDQYELLAKKFHYRPTTRVPYILYNSHHEFENTNVFFVNEYILGVTSPLDLRMALPFWGEMERFRQVSTHEMTHQFQIQKMADRAAAAGVDSPIDRMPLWFTEGLAEYYSRDGIDLETDMFGRDIVLNPRPDKGYALPDFWEDSRPSYIYTYKLGQIRVAFLADQYGERIIQAILDESPRLELEGGLSFFDNDHNSFKDLVARLAGERPDAIAQRFALWIKRRYLPEYLASTQEPPDIPTVNIEGEPDAFAALSDGWTILYRTVERDSGRAHLFLADRRDKGSAVQVAADGVPGTESLYPVLRSVMAISPGEVAFIARDGASDTLSIVPYARELRDHHVHFRLGARRIIRLHADGLIEAGDPTFSPSGRRVAFFGLDDAGLINIWVADLATGQLRRLTDDLFAERELSWTSDPPSIYGVPMEAGGDADGTIIYTSDQTERHAYNLMALDPATGAHARLTDEPADERQPYALGHGRVVFVSDARGKNDLNLYDAETRTIRRLTDFETGLMSPGPGPDGLTAVGFYGGQYQLFDIPKTQFLSLDVRPAMLEPPGPVSGFPVEPIPSDAPPYQPLKVGNWRLTNGIAAVGSSAFGSGAVLFGDVLNDRNLLVQFGIYGSLQLTDALAMYYDRAGRDTFGLGLYHTFTERRDLTPPAFPTSVFYLESEFGAQGIYSHPFNAFTRLELRAALEGVDRSFLFPITEDGSIINTVSVADLQQWNAERAGYDMEGQFSANIGFDVTRYAFPVGPVGGGSLFLEGGGGYLPLRSQAYGYAQFDGQVHFRPVSFILIHLRLAAGIAGGSPFGKQFWLSSYDNLRDFYPTDLRLIGTVFAVTNANLEVPLNGVIKVAFLSDIKFVAGFDLGGVAASPGTLWDERTLAGVLGVNLGLGPFEIRIQFADPIDLGNHLLPPGWVPNISLQYVYF